MNDEQGFYHHFMSVAVRAITDEFNNLLEKEGTDSIAMNNVYMRLMRTLKAAETGNATAKAQMEAAALASLRHRNGIEGSVMQGRLIVKSHSGSTVTASVWLQGNEGHVYEIEVEYDFDNNRAKEVFRA